MLKSIIKIVAKELNGAQWFQFSKISIKWFLLQLHDVRNFVDKADQGAAGFRKWHRVSGSIEQRPDDQPVLTENRIPLNVAKDPVSPEFFVGPGVCGSWHG